MPQRFSVVAIVAARNEADIIEQVVADLIDEGLSVYFIDDGSTDDTVAAVEPYLGRGVIQIENLQNTFGRETAAPFEWQRILARKAEIASELDADWFVHHDADEFRESPWLGLTLKEAIQQVDTAGYNAIDFASLDFWPTHDRFKPGDDIRKAFTHYASAAPYDRVQIRSWKKTVSPIDLASTGGHEARFEGRSVFPLRFISRHYPIRGQAHGEQKVFRERRGRFVEAERARGWHIQYDKLHQGMSFIRDAASLIAYDPRKVRLDLMIRHRGVETLENELNAIRTNHREHTGLPSDLTSVRETLTGLRKDYEMRSTEIAALHQHLEGVQAAARRTDEELRNRLREVYASRSWRVTAPLRAVYSLVTGRPRPFAEPATTTANGVRWGDLARVSPLSATWGTDRGLPVDRHYIHKFLDRHRAEIRGRVLEVKDPHYASTFGGSRVQHVDVLDIDAGNRQATLIVDLARADEISANQFDCFILTQTLHMIFDFKSALRHAERMLRPGGVLLCTIPALSRVDYEGDDFWRLTQAAVARVFSEVFDASNVTVATHGNVRVCTAFLYGLAAQELDPHDLAFDDPSFPLIHCVRAVKSSPLNQ